MARFKSCLEGALCCALVLKRTPMYNYTHQPDRHAKGIFGDSIIRGAPVSDATARCSNGPRPIWRGRSRSERRVSSPPETMLSARGETAHIKQGLRAGADDYLPKPFDPEELLLRIRALLRRAGR